MKVSDFRKHGHELIDWVADYLDGGVESMPVLPDMQPGDLRQKLPDKAPEQPEPMSRIIEDFHRLIIPAVTHWNHPRFFAYFPANQSPPSILAELLTAALGVNGMVWQSCPASTELEEQVMEWLRQLIGLPASFKGVIQDTASTATLCALLCARERATKQAFNSQGASAIADDSALRIYCSTEAHSSVTKGAKIAGYGEKNVVPIDVDEAFAMKPGDLEARIKADKERGLQPTCLVATLGTTSSTAIDPLRPLADIAERHDLWMHVDAALAGSAGLLPELAWIFEGLERADSYVFNPHKWLLTNFDCSAYFTRHPQWLLKTFAINPEYLETQADQQVSNHRDWGIQLGRRFRSLKLWFVLRAYGAEGLREMMRKHLALAQDFAAWVDADPNFERLAPTPLQTVCFRLHPKDEHNEQRLDELNASLEKKLNRSGQVFLTHTRLKEQYCLRMSIGQRTTEASHVSEAWALIQNLAQ